MSKKPNGQNESQEPFTVLVETLTGTTFKIKVSPQDRVRSIKCKLQRVEGKDYINIGYKNLPKSHFNPRFPILCTFYSLLFVQSHHFHIVSQDRYKHN